MKLRALLVEDEEDAALLVERSLRGGGYQTECLRVETTAAMRDALEEHSWDVILSDYSMPHFDALSALALLRESEMDLPFIVVSGTVGEERAVELMKAGVHDYVMKGNLQRLAPAVARELDEAEQRRARREADGKVAAALREKEVLLKEVHHRVKNNLQLLASIFRMQARRSEEPLVREALVSGQRRIHSLALIHERLCHSDIEDKVRLDGYVEQLLGDLRAASEVDVRAIEMRRQVSDVAVDLDTAVSCGLIINELVSNALEHAFGTRDSGVVQVDFNCSDTLCQLKVSDDGCGLPAAVDPDSAQSLGLKLVHILAEQLQGKVAFSTSDQGTEVTISFAALSVGGQL